MKNHLLPLCLIAAAMACNSATTESDTGTSDSAASKTVDTLLLQDPDKTDTVPAAAYPANASNMATAAVVRASLVDSIFKKDLSFIDSAQRKFVFSEYDLNGDGTQEIFVGFTGSYFCGTGGCTVLLLTAKGHPITQFSVTDYPIIIDSKKTNGWNDLILYSNGKNHLVKFNGKKYPSNPSVLPVFKAIPGDGLPRVLDWVHFPYPWFTF
jgi:hypothetical protein